jgi:hypothetical protein
MSDRLEKLKRQAEEAAAELERLYNITDRNAEEQRDLAQAAADATEALIAHAKATNTLTDGTAVSAEEINALTRVLAEQKAEARALSRAYDELLERQERIAGAAGELGKELAGLIPVIGGNVDFMDTFGGKLAAATKNAGSLSGGISDVVGKFREQFSVTQVATNVMAANEEMFAAYIAGTIAYAVAIQEQTAAFNKATGMMGHYNKAIGQAFRATTAAGASFEEAAGSFEALITTAARFTDMAPAQTQAIAETTTVLNELGIDMATTAENINIMTTSLNMNAGEAEETSRRLFTAAQQMGVAPQQMAADFAAAGAQFASFGENAVDAFLDLREAAKKTGIELQNLLSITEQFTTFEGAANNVGKLNALLGGPFLNTIDMVTLSLEDPAAALQEVRNAVLDAGLSFDDMNPAMRRAVAAAAGLEDAGQLAALMSGELDGLGGASSATAAQMEELREATKFTQTLADELEATRLAFTANFGPVIDNLIIPFLDKLQDLAETLGPTGAVSLAVASFGVVAVGTTLLVRRGIAATTAPVLALNTQLTALNANLAALAASNAGITATSPPASGALTGLGTAALATGKQMLILGGAIALIGVGVAAAAVGLSFLVESFSKLSGDQLFYAAAGLAGFAVSLAVLVGTMMFFAQPLGAAAIAGLLAVGGAVALIGTGIGAAAAGISLLISSIGELSGTANELEKIGDVFENLSIPKMVTYTTAMKATAAAGSTPAAAAVAAAAGAVGGGGGGGTTKVDVRIEGEVSKFLRAFVKQQGDSRYVQLKDVTPGGKINPGIL